MSDGCKHAKCCGCQDMHVWTGRDGSSSFTCYLNSCKHHPTSTVKTKRCWFKPRIHDRARSARHRAFAITLVRSLDAWDHAPEWGGGSEYGYRTREEFERQRALYWRTKRAARRWLRVMERAR